MLLLAFWSVVLALALKAVLLAQQETWPVTAFKSPSWLSCQQQRIQGKNGPCDKRDATQNRKIFSLSLPTNHPPPHTHTPLPPLPPLLVLLLLLKWPCLFSAPRQLCVRFLEEIHQMWLDSDLTVYWEQAGPTAEWQREPQCAPHLSFKGKPFLYTPPWWAGPAGEE